MDPLLEAVKELVAGLAVQPFFWLVAVLLFAYVATQNYKRLRDESPPILWPPGEHPVDQFEVDRGFSRTRTILTNRRIVHWHVSWFLSRRRLKTIALADVNAVVIHRRMNWVLLLVGFYLIGDYNPLAFALVLLGLQAPLYTVRANTPTALMPLTFVVVTTPWRAHLVGLQDFYRKIQATWSSVRSELGRSGSLDVANAGEPGALVDADFVWGRPALAFILGMMGVALLQHAIAPHVSFDDLMFSPFYLAIPVAVAARSLRDGFWVALLGFIGVLAVKFPGDSLFGLLASDGGVPAWIQYFWVLVALLGSVGVANVLARKAGLGFAPLAILVWVVLASEYTPEAWGDLAVYARIAMAMAVSVLLLSLDARLVAGSATKPVLGTA